MSVTMARDPYDVLGVKREASDGEIQKAFRGLAKKHHPDLNRNDKKSEDRFKEINAAYDIVGDDKKRARFDRGEIDAGGQEIRQNPFARGGFRPGAGGAQNINMEDFGDIFESMFGQGRARRGGGFGGGAGFKARGEDENFRLEVGFVEAVKGMKKRVTLPSGKSLDVAIPAGIEDGQTIRLRGQAAAGQGGGPAGDVLIEVKVAEHPVFKKRERDIHVELPVSLVEAVLGAKVEVETLSGAVSLTVPPGSNSGSVLRLRGRGLPAAGSKPAGDQYVTLKVSLPKEPDRELEDFVRGWSARHPYNPRPA